VVFVEEGTANAGTAFYVSSNDPHVPDTDDIDFTAFVPGTALGVADLDDPPVTGWTVDEGGTSSTTAFEAGKYPSIEKIGADDTAFYVNGGLITAATDFDVYAEINTLMADDTAATVGFFVGRNSDEKRLMLGIEHTGDLLVQRWTGTTFDSTQYDINYRISGIATLFVNIKRTSGDMEFRVSCDGLSWTEVFYTETVAAHIGDVDEYGLMISTTVVTAGQGTKITLKGVSDTVSAGEPPEKYA